MRRLVLSIVACVTATRLVVAQTPGDNLQPVLTGVRSYLSEYFARAQSIVADETVTIQQVASDMMPESVMARVLRNELRVSWEPSPSGGAQAATVLRSLVSVNGRAPRPKDEDKCFDPAAISPEILGELFLSDSASKLRYKLGKPRKIRGKTVTVIEIRDTETGPVTTQAKDADETCYSSSKPGMSWWRVSVNPEDYAILRLEEYLSGPLDVDLPASRKHGTPGRSLVYERLDVVIDYQLVTFDDPAETIMLPRTRQTVQMVRGMSGQNIRTSYSYKNYRRFMTGIRIVQ